MATVKKCDKCGAISSVDNEVKSTFSITYEQEAPVEYEEQPNTIFCGDGTDGTFEIFFRKEKFDLCDHCARKFYKEIKGHEPVKRLL